MSSGEPRFEDRGSSNNVEFRNKQREGETLNAVQSVARAADRRGALATAGAFSRLSRWLARMQAGRAADYRTPFYSERQDGKLVYPDRAEIVSILRKKMSSIAVDERLGGLLLPIEDEQAEDVGPWSTYLPFSEDGPSKIRAVYSDKPLTVDRPALERALEWFGSLVQKQSCDPVSIEEAIRGFPQEEGDNPEDVGGLDPSTNSGTPYVISPWAPKGGEGRQGSPETVEAYKWYVGQAKALIPLLTAGGEMPLQYAIASQRLVQKGPDPFGLKNKRMVIAMSKLETIPGKTLLVNVIEAWKQVMFNGVRIMCAWHNLPVIDKNMQILLQAASKAGRTVVSGDVSSFDATVPPELLVLVGNEIGRWVRGKERMWNALVHGMVYNTALITPDKIWDPAPSSLKSGSFCTSALGSACNLVINRYGHELGLYNGPYLRPWR